MCDENTELCEGTDLDVYFSNYWDNTNTEESQEEKQEEAQVGDNTPKEILINVEEELAKYPELNNGDDATDDEFEKL
jgi:hypothetical protein